MIARILFCPEVRKALLAVAVTAGVEAIRFALDRRGSVARG